MKAQDIQHIKQVFEKIYFLESELENSIESIQVKAEERVWMFDRWSPYPRTLTWKEAEKKFLSELTEEQRKGIQIKYNSEEYADLEEHDEESDCITMSVIFEK
jgi:hypothetical protein